MSRGISLFAFLYINSHEIGPIFSKARESFLHILSMGIRRVSRNKTWCQKAGGLSRDQFSRAHMQKDKPHDQVGRHYSLAYIQV